MASPNRPRVEFTPASINKVLELPPSQPNSQVSSAIGLLTGTGEGDVDPKSISIIPIDLSGHNSVLIRFKKPVMPYVPKAKGLDNHELRIQRLSDTEPRTEELDRASLDGFDTGHDALIASMNSVRQTYFSTTDVMPSPQLIRVQAKNGDMVEIPLYVPIIFFGPSGKKSVAVVTRFPREYIAVEVSKSLDKPVGIVAADENKIVRQPAISTQKPSYEWAFSTNASSQSPSDTPTAVPFVPVDGEPNEVRIDFKKLEAERASKTPLEKIVSGLDNVKRTRDAKRLMHVLDDTTVDSQARLNALARWRKDSRVDQEPADSPVVLFAEIAQNIVEFQDILDNAPRTNGSHSWILYTTGRFFDALSYAWRVDVPKITSTADHYRQKYQKLGSEDRRKNYVEYATLKQLLDSEWAVYKKWKN